MDIALDPFPFAGGTTTFDPSFTGGVRVGVADYSSDGTLDILAGSSIGAGGTMNVFNYETLDLIDSLSISDSTQGTDVASNFSRGNFGPLSPRWRGE